MDVSALLDLVSAVAIVSGLVFAGLQVRAAQQARSRDTQMILVRSFETPEFTHSMQVILALPDGLTKKDMEARLGDDVRLVFFWFGSMGSLGILVHHRQLPLDLVDDFFSGPVVLSWRKLRGYVEDERRELDRDTMHEWFQWLAERMAEREQAGSPVPAHMGERDWVP